jgi:hypothetical protein
MRYLIVKWLVEQNATTLTKSIRMTDDELLELYREIVETKCLEQRDLLNSIYCA